MNKRNRIKIIVIVIVLLVVMFLGYRLFMYYRYTMDKPEDISEIVNGFKNPNTIHITKKVLSEGEYFTKDHFKMRNIFDGYVLTEDNTANVFMYRKEVGDKSYAIQLASEEVSFQLTDSFVDDSMVVFGEGDIGFLKGNITDADRKGFLEKNNIKTDIDFYKFFAEHYFIESNLFTDIKTLKQNYAFNLFSYLAIPKIDSWTIIEGDVEGYIFYVGTKEDVSIYSITIMSHGKRYGILTSDPRFKDESFMIDFISTIEIN